MSFNLRRIPPHGASNKRKEREPFDSPAPLPNNNHGVTKSPKSFLNPPALADPLPIDNRILAGYMAHEFLTRGTILGQRFDPGRSEAVAVASQRKGSMEETEGQSQRKQEHLSYGDVAGMMMRTDGVHIPGVVNPSQLATWLTIDEDQMFWDSFDRERTTPKAGKKPGGENTTLCRRRPCKDPGRVNIVRFSR